MSRFLSSSVVMAVSSSSSYKSRSSGPVLRSISPAGNFYSSTSPSPSSSMSLFASSSSAHFYCPSSGSFQNCDDLHHHNHRSASPTRINYSPASLTPSVRFSIDQRSISPSRSIAVTKHKSLVSLPRKSCLCSPTTHPGSFRCSFHKNIRGSGGHHRGASFQSTSLNMRRSAMTNSIVRIGGVEGELVRRSLTSLIRPSSHQLRRRAAFQPKPSRLSSMSKADLS